METPVLIIAAVLFVLGMLVRKYPNLIAGYNTMTAEQKKNVDVKGLSNLQGSGEVFGSVGLCCRNQKNIVQ